MSPGETWRPEVGLEERWGPPWEEAARKPLRLGGKTLRAESVGLGRKVGQSPPAERDWGAPGMDCLRQMVGLQWELGDTSEGPFSFRKQSSNCWALTFF